MNEQLERNKMAAMAFYDLMFNQCQPRQAMERFAGAVYIQHNPHVADGKEAFIAYFEKMAREYPGKRVHFKRAFAEGNHVVLSDRVQELRVGLELADGLEEPLHRFDRLEREQGAAQLLHLFVFVLGEELLLLAGAGGLDVDGWPDALLGELAVEVDLGVAGALELLEDHLVHARPGVD